MAGMEFAYSKDVNNIHPAIEKQTIGAGKCWNIQVQYGGGDLNRRPLGQAGNALTTRLSRKAIYQCKPVYTGGSNVYQCILVHTSVYRWFQCISVYTSAYQCIPVYNSLYPCLPV